MFPLRSPPTQLCLHGSYNEGITNSPYDQKEKKMNKIGTCTAAAAMVGLLLAPATFAEQARDAQKETGMSGTDQHTPPMPAQGDQKTPAAPAQEDQETMKPSSPTELTGRAMPGSKASLVKASDLIGYSVKNRKGEDLGAIEELVINSEDGRISYAVLSVGGILGMGDKLFAIPWAALTPRPGEQAFNLDVNKEKLTEAPGFDENNWPNMADREWGANVHKFYDQKPAVE
jgi:sporulation protein YlmC with PRC-barrel domain